MLIPIYIDGTQEGTLRLEDEAGTTVAEAELRDVGRVVRLSVFGEREFYLGIPEPEKGTLRLVRRLSAGEMRRFPRNPAYAAERRESVRPPAPEEAKAPEGSRHVLWHGGKPYFFP